MYEIIGPYLGELLSAIVMGMLSFVAWKIKARDTAFKELISSTNELKVQIAQNTVKIDGIEKSVDRLFNHIMENK